MSGRAPTTALTTTLLRIASRLLPAEDRAGWIDEWRGEIAAAREDSRRSTWWTEARLLPGVVTDALATRAILRAERRRPARANRLERLAGNRLDGWRSDVRYAAKGLAARPAYALAAAATLALGIGATTAVFSAVNGVLLRDLPYGEVDRVVVLRQFDRRDGSNAAGVSAANLHDVAGAARTLQHVSLADGIHGLRLERDGRAESLRTWVVSQGFFDALDARPLVGRLFRPAEYEPGGGRVVILGQAAWEGRFGADPSVIGRDLVLDDVAHRVVGVLPAAFAYPSAPDAWTPRAFDGSDEPFRGRARMPAVARLDRGVDLEQAQSELDRLAAELSRTYPEANANLGLRLTPLRDELLGDIETPLALLLGAVGLVLLIASANVAGLQLARGTTRAREDAVRAALGATAGRVVRLAAAESVLLALAGGAAGVSMAFLGVDLIRILGADHIPRIDEVHIDRTVLGFAVAVSLGSAFLAGIAPVLRTSRIDLRSVLADASRGSTGGPRATTLRDRLVVGQIAVAVVLGISAGLLLRSFDRILDNDLGFDPTGLVATQVWAYDAQHQADFGYFERGAAALRAIPGVEGVGITSNLPLASDELLARPIPVSFEVVERAGEGPDLRVADLSAVDHAYPAALGVRVAAGRAFTSDDDAASRPVAMVNEAFVRRFLGGADPLGARILLHFRDGRVRDVVGVLADVRRRGLESEPLPEVYVPLAQEAFNGLTFVIRTRGDARSTVEAAREALWETDPGQAVWANRTVADLLSEWSRRRTFNTVLLVAFAALALALSAIGIYGVTAFAVEERASEFGIRRALGGDASTIVGTVLKRGAGLAASGIALGIVGALGVTRLLSSLLFGVDPVDPVTFVGLGIGVLGLTLLAALLPAARATRVDPLEVFSGRGR